VGEAVRFQAIKFPPEVLTDPSLQKKIVILDTASVDDRWPMPDDYQSFMPHLSGLVILGSIQKSLSDAHFTLHNYLESNRICGFVPDGSEKLQRYTARFRSVMASIERECKITSSTTTTQIAPPRIDLKAIASPQEYLWDLASGDLPSEQFNIVVWDFGMSYSLLRNLRKLGCKLRIVPPATEPERIIALHPDGVVIAGGPLDQEVLQHVAAQAERVIGIRPVLGVGSGALVVARAIGTPIELLENPHFGSALDVRRPNGSLISTYQAHSLAPGRGSLVKAGAEICSVNHDDGSPEEFVFREYDAMGMMYSLSAEPIPSFLTSFVSGFLNVANPRSRA